MTIPIYTFRWKNNKKSCPQMLELKSGRITLLTLFWSSNSSVWSVDNGSILCSLIPGYKDKEWNETEIKEKQRYIENDAQSKLGFLGIDKHDYDRYIYTPRIPSKNRAFLVGHKYMLEITLMEENEHRQIPFDYEVFVYDTIFDQITGLPSLRRLFSFGANKEPGESIIQSTIQMMFLDKTYHFPETGEILRDLLNTEDLKRTGLNDTVRKFLDGKWKPKKKLRASLK